MPDGGASDRGLYGRALALSLGTAVSNGFGRFCYALILPSMQVHFSWTYAEAGWLNGVNAVGYLVGALIAPRVIARHGAQRSFSVALIVTAIAVIVMGLAVSYGQFLFLRGVGGASGAIAFIAGGVIAASLTGDIVKAGTAITIYFTGIALAMLVAGIALPSAFGAWGDGLWSLAWIAIGLLALAACVPAIVVARKVSPRHSMTPARAQPVIWRQFSPSLIGYFCFGCGYIGYMTFIIAFLRGNAASALEMTLVWTVLSLSAMTAPLWWRVPLARWGGMTVLGLATSFTGVGAALALYSDSLVVVCVSAAVFGASFLVTPAAVTAYAKRSLAPGVWPSVVSGYTVVFALGQIAGPVLTGWLADLSGGLRPGLIASSIILMVGGVICFAQRSIVATPRQ